VVAGLLGQSITAIRNGGQRRSAYGAMALTLVLTLAVLNLSGATRGEVGRLWLLFMPATAIVAGGYWHRATGHRTTMLLLLASQLVLALAIGLAWRPIQAVILPVARPDVSADSQAAMTPLNITFQSPSDRPVTLEGFAIADHEGEPAVTVDLFWSSRRPTVWPYVVFVHVLDEDGELAAQQDGWPVAGHWPTTCWAGGEMIVDTHHIPLPDDLPTGRYAIITGLYEAASGERLIAAGERDHVLLGHIVQP
jgi:hypothetical protein